MTANLWRRRWCDGGGGILLLLLLLVTWPGGGGVSGQLYTSVEELKDGVDKTYGPDLLPLGLVHRYEVKLRRTCMVPFDVLVTASHTLLLYFVKYNSLKIFYPI